MVETHGRAVTASDVDSLYERFIALQFECLKEHSSVISGVPAVVDTLRSRGIKIGSTTGYIRAMLDVLVAEAAREGYLPDCSLSPEDAGSGRPYPFMIYAAAVKMQVYPWGAIVKVGDTTSDIKEGLNAGAWSVGVAGTGNALGMSEAKFHALDAAERATQVQRARAEAVALRAWEIGPKSLVLPLLLLRRIENSSMRQRLAGRANRNGHARSPELRQSFCR
jgi:phosphonoacetaldehyde hydrolase